jgi:hypothetical protein
MSAAPPRGIVAHGCAVVGLTLSSVRPSAAATCSPPISWRSAASPSVCAINGSMSYPQVNTVPHGGSA